MKLIALDVDGTLIPYGSQEISKRNKEAIQKAASLHHVSLCTGRCFRESKEIIEDLGLKNNYHILGGGGLIHFDNQFSSLGSLSSDLIAELIHELKNSKIFNRKMFISKETGSWETLEQPEETTMLSIEVPLWDEQAIVAEKFLQNKYPELLITHVLGHEYDEWWIQISDKNTHKGAGLVHVSEKINAEETIAFGDALNDIGLFMHSNTSVAMSNAPKDLKRHATHEINSGPEAIADGLIMLGII